MFAFVNPICWLKRKTVQPNSNTNKLFDHLSTGGLMSQPSSPQVQPRRAWFLVSRVKNWPYWNL